MNRATVALTLSAILSRINVPNTLALILEVVVVPPAAFAVALRVGLFGVERHATDVVVLLGAAFEHRCDFVCGFDGHSFLGVRGDGRQVVDLAEVFAFAWSFADSLTSPFVGRAGFVVGTVVELEGPAKVVHKLERDFAGARTHFLDSSGTGADARCARRERHERASYYAAALQYIAAFDSTLFAFVH